MPSNKPDQYRGRFAPSPTGLLHLGSLVSALGSYLDARAHSGNWLVRIEDIDPTRERPGAGQSIIESLAAHGMRSDQPVQWQSQHSHYYEQALQQLSQQGQIYACRCNARARKRYQQQPCPCYALQLQFERGCNSWRLRLAADSKVEFRDCHAGYQKQNLNSTVGDFTLQRSDGYYAYQLAVVVDDARARISHVVRGQDLLTVTPRQIYLQKALGLATPSYLHLPLVENSAGQKLSKQNKAPALANSQALANLQQACQHLHLHRASHEVSIYKLLRTATSEWQEQRQQIPNES